jgi:hypothetical protein
MKRIHFVLAGIVLLATVVLAFAAPLTPAMAADACLGAIGELDVIGRPRAFDRRGAADAMAMMPVWGAFFMAILGVALLRLRMLRMRWGRRR